MDKVKNELHNEGTILAAIVGSNNILHMTINQNITNMFCNDIQHNSRQERGKYVLAGPSFAKGAQIAQFIQNKNQGCVPGSVSIDTLDCAPVNMERPVVTEISSSGALIESHGTGTYLSCKAAGNITFNY